MESDKKLKTRKETCTGEDPLSLSVKINLLSVTVILNFVF